MLKKTTVLTMAALGGLLCATAAQAQSSVTLYGIVDAGLLYSSKTVNATGGNGGKFLGFTDAGQLPSLFGMKGDEDLGGGLHAEFDLESGIDTANGGLNNTNGNLFGRQAWVGLRGDFGAVRAGLQFSPFFDTALELDPRDMSELGSALPIYLNNIVATGIFSANALTYSSPTIAGLQGSAMYAPGGVAGSFQSGQEFSAALSYHWSGLGLYGSYFKSYAGGTETPIPSAIATEARELGVTYKYGPVTAKAAFTNYKVDASGMNNNVYSAGLDYHATPALDLNGGVYYMVNRDATASKSLMGALGATYNLSARTAFYVQAGLANNKGNQNVGLDVGNASTSLYAPAGTTVGVDVGIHHMF